MMFKGLFLLASLLSVAFSATVKPLESLGGCGKSIVTNTHKDRILGGRHALEGEFPWQVSVRTKNWLFKDFFHICGGSIINERYIVTAAHCVFEGGPDVYEVLIGEHQFSDTTGQESYHKVSDILFPPGYIKEGVDHDIALIKLEDPIDLSSWRVNIVCLPEPDYVAEGWTTVSGWGHTTFGGTGSDILKAVDLPIVSQEACRKVYKELKPFMLCAGLKEGGHSVCRTDSGGPMVQYKDGRAFLVGIVSFGEGCRKPGVPDVYTRVNMYTEWILKNAV